MQIEIKIDESCKEPKIIIATNQMTEEVSAIIQKLSAEQPTAIVGLRDEFTAAATV